MTHDTNTSAYNTAIKPIPQPQPQPQMQPQLQMQPFLKLHLSRRIQHALTGLILLFASHILPSLYPHAFFLLSLATFAFYYLHQKRIREEAWDDWYLRQFGGLLRRHEVGEWEYYEMMDDGTCERDVGHTTAAMTAAMVPNSSTNNKKTDHATSKTTHNGTNNNNGNTTTHHDDAKTKKRRRRKTPPQLPGAFYFLLGTTILAYTFSANVPIARTSLLVLSLADPMAGIVGVAMSNASFNCTWQCLIRIMMDRIIIIMVRTSGKRRRRRMTIIATTTAAMKREQQPRGESKNGGGGGGGGGPTIAGSMACALVTIACTYIYIPSSITTSLASSSSSSSSAIPSTLLSTGTSTITTTTLTTSSRIGIGIVTAFVESISGRIHFSFFRGWIDVSVVDDNLLIPLVVSWLIYWLDDSYK